MEEVKGYKVFNPDWTCRGFQYELGKTYEMEANPLCCNRGFHFCKKASDCFNYYSFDSNNKVAEVTALGLINNSSDGDKSCTNKIRIDRELTWHEVLDLVNTGKDCTGRCNSGDWNKASYCLGCFNTVSQKLKFFDEETDVTFEDWRRSEAYYLLSQIDDKPLEWVWACSMSDQEKEENPDWEINDGYLKKRDVSKANLKWWHSLTKRQKKIIQNIPNFNAEKFKLITGIDVNED